MSSSSSSSLHTLLAMYSSPLFRGMENARNGGLEEAAGGFHLGPILSPRSSACNQYGGLGGNASVQSLEMGGKQSFQRGSFENGDCNFRADCIDPFDKIGEFADERFAGGDGGYGGGCRLSVDSSGVSMEKTEDDKIMRRLAQNREAARKSRLRKKAYVQHLENSRLKLMQLEQELQRVRQQGMVMASGYLGNHGFSVGGNGALIFDMEYARWLDEHQNQISDLRAALNSRADDDELRLLVDALMAHYDVIFKLKSIAMRSDVFHILSGLWTTPAERCFMWLGGFRSSEILKMLVSQLEPLTDQQLIGICNLQQSSQQAEDALSQGMEALQQSLTDTLSPASFNTAILCSDNVASYMNQMAIAMGKLGTLENFLRQADLLRQQTLQQMHRILNARQAGQALLATSDYFSRLRALSSLWLARPRD